MPLSIKKKVSDSIYLGIDPGQKGGLVALHPDGEIRYTIMPETELDVQRWFGRYQAAYGPVHAVLEKVTSSPQMGVSSAFTFGKGYGGLRMVLSCIECQWEDVTPQTWYKALHIPFSSGKSDGEKKLKLKKIAQQLYPKLEVWNEAKYKYMAVCDALLLAHYCKCKYEGTLG